MNTKEENEAFVQSLKESKPKPMNKSNSKNSKEPKGEYHRRLVDRGRRGQNLVLLSD